MAESSLFNMRLSLVTLLPPSSILAKTTSIPTACGQRATARKSITNDSRRRNWHDNLSAAR
jgi:hypothetical protein